MSAAYYIVLEREITGLDTIMNGKSLSRNIAFLDRAARELGVRPLSDFCSMPLEELAELMGAAADAIALPPLKQFAAQDGLATLKVFAVTPRSTAGVSGLERVRAYFGCGGRAWGRLAFSG